ncbi:MAG: GntR family transcriptional regulator [Coprobacillaceae bacterium]
MQRPIYVRIIDQIRDEIKVLDVNSAIPSERELAEKYNASRMTVRKAVNKLVEDGYLYRDGNKGTFVSNQKLHKDSLISNVMEELTSQNNMRILYYDIKNGIAEITQRLEIPVEENYVRIVRLITQNNNSISIEEIYIVHGMLKNQDMSDVTKVFEYSETIQAGSIRQVFIPMVVPVKYANLLELKIGTPLIMIESTIHTKAGRVYAFIRSYTNPKNKVIEMTF